MPSTLPPSPEPPAESSFPEMNFRNLFETSRDAIMLLDARGFFYCNPATLTLFGCPTRDQFQALHPAELSPPMQADGGDSRTAAQTHIEDAYRDGSQFFEWTHRRLDGTVFPAEVLLSRLDFEGRAALQAVVRDITVRKQADATLRQLRQAVGTSGEIVFMTDVNGIFTYVNPAFTHLYGLESDEVVGKVTPRILNSGQMNPGIYAEFWRTLLAKHIVRGELVNRTKAGALVTVDISVSPVLDDHGQIGGFLAVQRDVSERKRAEQTILKQKAILEGILDSDSSAVFSVDQDGRFTSFNRVYAEIMQRVYGATISVGDNMLDCLTDAENRRAAEGHLARALAGERFAVETAFEDEQPRRFLRITHNPILDANGQCVGAAVFAKDITEQKQAHDQILESRRMLQTVIDTLPGFVFWKNRHSAYLGCNRQFADAAQLPSPEAIVGKNDYDMVWSREESDAYRADDREVMNSGIAKLHIIEPQKQADGSAGWLDTSKVPLRDATGQVFGVLGVYTNITEQKAATDALKESEERFRIMADSSPIIIWVTDARGGIQFVNRTYCDFFGTEPAQIQDRGWEPLIHPEDRVGYLAAFESAIDGAAAFRAETRVKGADGEWRWIVSTATPRFSPQGDFLGHAGTSLDITERKQAEAERERLESRLRQSQKLETIGTLAGGIAHDFNNLLVPILVYSDMAVQSLAADDPLRDDLVEILSSANRAKELVKQILAFSRHGEPDCAVMEPVPIIKEAIKLLRASLPATIHIAQDIAPQCGSIHADPSQIHQVVMNLCTNAYHAMRAHGGVLGVSLRTHRIDAELAHTYPQLGSGDCVRLTVSDTGCGMDAPTVERIFEPFFTTKQVGDGTGLGLSVVHGIVSKYGGAISVHSVPGQGTTFDVYLPLVHAAVAPPAAVPALTPGHERILVVDDEPAVAAVTCRVLEQLGYTVTVCTRSPEALTLFQADARQFDLVITDLTMPDITGDRLARSFRAIRPELPILLMTGYNDAPDGEHYRDSGVDGTLLKPLPLKELSRAVREALDRRALSLPMVPPEYERSCGH